MKYEHYIVLIYLHTEFVLLVFFLIVSYLCVYDINPV